MRWARARPRPRGPRQDFTMWTVTSLSFLHNWCWLWRQRLLVNIWYLIAQWRLTSLSKSVHLPSIIPSCGGWQVSLSSTHIWHRHFPVSLRVTLLTLLSDHESCDFSGELLPDRMWFPADMPTYYMENGGDDNKVMRGDALFAEADMIAQSQLPKLLRTFVAAKQAKSTTESGYSCGWECRALHPVMWRTVRLDWEHSNNRSTQYFILEVWLWQYNVSDEVERE